MSFLMRKITWTKMSFLIWRDTAVHKNIIPDQVGQAKIKIKVT